MKFTLKRIIYGKYDEFVEKTLSFLPNLTIDNFNKYYSDMTEEINVNGEAIELSIDVEELLLMIKNVRANNFSNPMQVLDIKISKALYESLTLSTNVPDYLLYEREVWAYINCFILFDVVVARYFYNPNDLNDEGRVQRVLLADCSTLDRTGFGWLWALADATYSEEYLFSLTETAHRFIDPAKALYERSLGTNKILFKAFIRSIQLQNYDPRIRSSKYRSILLTHIRNMATMKIYESYNSVEELAKIFVADIKSFLGDSILEDYEQEND